jgi:branched-chain amino acid transport system substrate-binding protein
MRTHILLAGLLLAGCRQNASTVKLGMAGPLSENYGMMTLRGAQLARDEINARPDQRIKIQLDTADDGADGKRAAKIAQRFVDDPQVVGVVGHVTSGAMKAAAKVYDGSLTAIATSASAAELTGISPWAFRVISSDSANGVTLARFANRLGKRRVAILYENSAYGRGLAESFRQNFRGEVLSFDPIGEGRDQDFEPFVAFFQQRKPELLFVASTEVSGLPLVRAIRAAGLSVDLMGGDGWTGMTLDPANAEGVYVGAPFTGEDTRPEARRFTERFRERYHMEPDGNAALGYDATQLFAAALRAVGGERARIQGYMTKLDARSALSGATGRVHFTSGGDPARTGMVMTRVERGVLKLAEAR